MKRYDMVAYSADIFEKLMPFRDPQISNQLPENTGILLRDALVHLTQVGSDAGVPSHILNESKYALTALIDEYILNSAWPGRLDWSNHLLQVELFSERMAGVHFFNKIEKLKQAADRNVDVLELYYACLVLGFQGQYRFEDGEKLKALSVSLSDVISHYRGPLDTRLSEPFNMELPEKQNRKMPITHKIIYVSVGLIVAMYLIYGLIIQNRIENHMVMQDYGYEQSHYNN